MSEAGKVKLTQWLHATPPVPGVLARGIRFADETFVSAATAPNFPAAALEQAWRVVADAFQVLRAQRLPPDRLTWRHEKTTLHCVQRADGAILGICLAGHAAVVDPLAVEKMLSEFRHLE
jgi:hypothetical protein